MGRDLTVVSALNIVETEEEATTRQLKAIHASKELITTHSISDKRNCKYCGTNQKVRKYPAQCKMCMKCKKLGHFACTCFSIGKRAENKMKVPRKRQSSGDESMKKDIYFHLVETKN